MRDTYKIPGNMLTPKYFDGQTEGLIAGYTGEGRGDDEIIDEDGMGEGKKHRTRGEEKIMDILADREQLLETLKILDSVADDIVEDMDKRYMMTTNKELARLLVHTIMSKDIGAALNPEKENHDALDPEILFTIKNGIYRQGIDFFQKRRELERSSKDYGRSTVPEYAIIKQKAELAGYLTATLLKNPESAFGAILTYAKLSDPEQKINNDEEYLHFFKTNPWLLDAYNTALTTAIKQGRKIDGSVLLTSIEHAKAGNIFKVVETREDKIYVTLYDSKDISEQIVRAGETGEQFGENWNNEQEARQRQNEEEKEMARQLKEARIKEYKDLIDPLKEKIEELRNKNFVIWELSQELYRKKQEALEYKNRKFRDIDADIQTLIDAHIQALKDSRAVIKTERKLINRFFRLFSKKDTTTTEYDATRLRLEQQGLNTVLSGSVPNDPGVEEIDVMIAEAMKDKDIIDKRSARINEIQREIEEQTKIAIAIRIEANKYLEKQNDLLKRLPPHIIHELPVIQDIPDIYRRKE